MSTTTSEGAWVAYQSDNGPQVDSIHDTEVAALRRALDICGHVVHTRYGEEIRDAIQRDKTTHGPALCPDCGQTLIPPGVCPTKLGGLHLCPVCGLPFMSKDCDHPQAPRKVTGM